MKNIKQTFFIFLFFLSVLIFAQQSSVDSLLKISYTKNDTATIKLYQKIAQKYYNISTDSTIIYLKKSVTIANKLFSKYKNDTLLKAYLPYVYDAYDFSRDFFWHNENYDDYLSVTERYLEYSIFIKDSSGIASAYNGLGNIYKFRSNFDKALTYYRKSLSIKEKTGNKQGVAYNNIGIANVFINWEKYPEAIKHYQKCFEICQKIEDTLGLAAASTGMGNVYRYLNKIPEALKYQKLSYKFYISIKDTEGIALSLLNIGDVYMDMQEFDKALNVYNEALDLFIKKDIKIRIALTYNMIGAVHFNKKDFNKAIDYYKKSISVAIKTGYKKVVLDAYKNLSDSYKEKNSYKKSYEFLNKYYQLKDSIFNEEKHKQLTEIETKYQTSQKEKIIKEQKFEIEKDKILNEKRTTQINLVLIAMLFLIGLLFFIFRSYRIKKRSNLTLQKQKEEIEEIHHEISQSIDYATRLQGAVLPEQKILEKHLSEHFVLFKPKDKVSGDFYWWAHIENHTIITAADSTGHGVPGAFMSMLGASFLREIVQKEYITHTGVILRKLRKEIIKALKQTGESGTQKDGMDMAIISIDHETNIVQFSGANNPLYIINPNRKEWPQEAIPFGEGLGGAEVKPNKMPIAIYEKMDAFATHEIQLEKGDQLYMFSDGYADQFGGPKGKKFKYKPFKRLLLENADKPMQEQKEILNQAFENWKGSLEQIDDVVVVGVKI